MIKWFKKNSDNTKPQNTAEQEVTQAEDIAQSTSFQEDVVPETKRGILKRFKQGLSKTRHHFGDGIARLFLGRKEIDATLLEELETILLSSDVGIDATHQIIQKLKERLARKELADGQAVYRALMEYLAGLLKQESLPSVIEKMNEGQPFVILMVGINGAGKTTTIGKLAKQLQQQGKKVMLAAGDTFRAAAVEQLQTWGQRNQVPVIAQHTGADSASVIYDALQAAKSRGVDVLIADTAGRLHTQQNLMDELKKVKRVMKKIDEHAPHEVMLVLDASIGQNALNQARQFHQEIGVTGITMTKLDGTAKGGILFAIVHELGIPFRYVGIGEGVDDLRVFDATHFVNAIFNDDQI